MGGLQPQHQDFCWAERPPVTLLCPAYKGRRDAQVAPGFMKRYTFGASAATIAGVRDGYAGVTASTDGCTSQTVLPATTAFVLVQANPVSNHPAYTLGTWYMTYLTSGWMPCSLSSW